MGPCGSGRTLAFLCVSFVVLTGTADHYAGLEKVIQLLRRAGKLEECPKFLEMAEKSSSRAALGAGYNYCKGLYEWYVSFISVGPARVFGPPRNNVVVRVSNVLDPHNNLVVRVSNVLDPRNNLVVRVSNVLDPHSKYSKLVARVSNVLDPRNKFS